MKSFLFATIVLVFMSITLQSQTKDTVYVVTRDTVYMQNTEPNTKRISAEFGVALGTPAVINLIFTKHFDDFLIKLSGLYLSRSQGYK